MKRGRPAKAIKRSWYNFVSIPAADDESRPRSKRRLSMASLWRLFDPLPVGLAVITLGIIQFDNLSGRTMASGLAILLVMLIAGQVLEPCWQKQCVNSKTMNES